MSPGAMDERDAPFWSHRERARAVLRHLILERRLNPCHPLVAGYDHHLHLGTAHAEYTRALELGLAGLDPVALRTVCFRGADLSFRHCDRVATSVYREDEERDREGRGWEREREGRKSWERERERKEGREEEIREERGWEGEKEKDC